MGRINAGGRSLRIRNTIRREIRQLLPTIVAVTASALIVPGAMAADADEATVEGVVVTATKDGYKAKSTTSSTKLPLSLRETPQSVTVITRQRMDDFNLTSVANVL